MPEMPPQTWHDFENLHTAWQRVWQAPAVLRRHYHLSRPRMTTTADKYKYITICYHILPSHTMKSFSQSSYSVATAIVWNILPVHVQSSPSIATFR